ncbi:monooxygenase [Decorospora gaudefroyi]|uniref:Monooxygenase n=1 Tax=Decorospora gaudefroyi TaxID=184978 RepID=A0A6A5KSM1_9PLEO|nr:monooxygenase [Decorospora gaudefroyi]
MASTNVMASDDETLNTRSTNGTSIPQPNGASHPNNNNNNNTSPSLPIIIAGGGCVGLFLALLLSHSPIRNPIIIIEPQTPDPSSTRAMAHQPLTYPILAQVPNLLPELVQAGSLSSGLCFRTSVQHGSRLIAGKEFDDSGDQGMQGKGQLLLPQGKFQKVLMRRLEDRAEIRIGWSVSAVTPSGRDCVGVHVTPTSPTQLGDEKIEATYLIDASGAHSHIRKQLDIKLEGETLDAQLVATDLSFDFRAHGFYDANFIMDPVDYGLVGRINSATDGQPALWRVSYGVPLGVSEEDIWQKVDDKLRVMLPNGGRDEKGEVAYKVVRIAPYKAQQRLASTLYDASSRTCLVGDAAHLTNPYAGLGLASGIADASSLSDVLIRILTDEASDPERLLESWSEARRKKFLEAVDKPSRMAYKRVKADVNTDEKVQEFVEKDPLVGALKSGMPVKPPSLETKGEELEGW